MFNDSMILQGGTYPLDFVVYLLTESQSGLEYFSGVFAAMRLTRFIAQIHSILRMREVNQ